MVEPGAFSQMMAASRAIRVLRFAVHFRAVREDHRAAVAVTVEDDAQVRVCVQGRLPGSLHGFTVLRIRDVVREGAVRIQEDAAGDIRTQRSQDLFREEAGGAVACVLHDVETLQRMIVIRGIHFFPDQGLHVFTVDILHVEGLRCDASPGQTVCAEKVLRILVAVFFRELRRMRQDPGQVFFRQGAVLREELHAVPVEGQMAGGDHHGTVKITGGQHRGLEHGRSGDQSAVKTLDFGETEEAGVFDDLRGDTAVVAHTRPEILFLLAGLLRQVIRESAGDELHQRSGEGPGLCVDGNGRTAHVISVLHSGKKLFKL